MAKAYRWVFQVVDRISGPTRRMERSLGSLAGRMEKMGRATNAMETALVRLRRPLGSVGVLSSGAERRLLSLENRMRGVAKSARAMGVSLQGASRVQLQRRSLPVNGPPEATQVVRPPRALAQPARARRSRARVRNGALSQYGVLQPLPGPPRPAPPPSLPGASSVAGGVLQGNLMASAVEGLVGAIVSLTKALATAGLEAGKFAVRMFSFKESTLASLKLMLGSEQQAQQMFAEMLRFAKKTPFETQDVVQGYTSMLGAGFTKDQAGKVFAALGDVASMSGFDKQVIDKITLAFSQIKAKGRLQGEEMLQIFEASGRAGVGAVVVYEKIAKKLGIASSQVAKAISAGKVDSDTGILAILEAIQDRAGGKVGNIMLEQSKTLTGLMSTLSSVPGDFLLSMDLSNLTGFEAFKGFVSNLVKVLDTSSAAGKQLMRVLELLFNNVFQGLFGGLTGANGVARLEEVISTVSGVVENYAGFIKNVLQGVGGFFSGLWKNLRPALASLSGFYKNLSGKNMGSLWEWAGDILGRILGAMLQIVVVLEYMTRPIRWMMDALETLSSGWETVKNTFTEMGQSWGLALTTGLQSGILGGMGIPVGAITSMVGAVTTAYTVPTQTNSPSGLFRDYGGWAMEGYAQGVWKKFSMAEEAVREAGGLGTSVMEPELAMSLPSMAGAQQAQGQGNGGLSITIQELHIHTSYAPGSPEGTAVLQADLREGLMRAMREIALELGVKL